MVKKRDLIIAGLITFCLTATLFLMKPTRSQTPGQYDPWLDVNEDGKILIEDVAWVAKAFGTSGDPTKNVNVTNPRAVTLEKELNISTSFLSGKGSNWTDSFATGGYDRMFVSAAIIDVSDRAESFVYVGLYGANWIWGMINGTYVETETPANDSNNQLSIGWSYDEYQFIQLPVSGVHSAEYAIEAAQCKLGFRAASSLSGGWVLLHVSVYLTVGTTSPPAVQDTYVTNWPYIQPDPAYDSYSLPVPINASVTNGNGWGSMEVSIGGYSRMFVKMIEVVNASYQGVPITTTVSLSDVDWSLQGSFESVPSGVLNATYNGTYLPVYSSQIPPEFKTRNYSCRLWFNISSGAISGWVEFYVRVYLRNE